MKLPQILNKYLLSLIQIARQPEATDELSFRKPIHTFFEDFSRMRGYETSVIIHDPKRKAFGAPDFVIKKGYYNIGYVETKGFWNEDLESIAESEQLQKYLGRLPNLLLTNYTRFILYQDGRLVDDLLLVKPQELVEGEIRLTTTYEKIQQFLDLFFQKEIPAITSSENLASMLAIRARILFQSLHQKLKVSTPDNPIFQLYNAYKTHLMPELTIEQFADFYSQAITYGTLMSYVKSGEERFTRDKILKFLPQSVPLIRALFQITETAEEELPSEIRWVLDDVCSILSASAGNITRVIYETVPEEFSEDPFVFFYESFLQNYNPEERERRGVYYTPDPVVSFIIRSADELLNKEFDKSDGLASESVTLLDPAVGTGTFLTHAIEAVYSRLKEQDNLGIFPDIVQERILRNFFGLELLAAPYIICHLKVSRHLEKLGYTLGPRERIQIYLTNTLIDRIVEQTPTIFLHSLSQEAVSARKVKKEKPILVVVGNPPYSGHSYNKGPFIDKLIESYKSFEGESLDEKNPKWLNDDYVKFIRWAQWKIINSFETTGGGIIGFITNNAYLDNPTFRIMRKNLLSSFSKIYILNLHGNVRLKEKTPDGELDENVFDIRPGVAILIAIKEHDNIREAKIFYTDLWGSRKEKYKVLNIKTLTDLESQMCALKPEKPRYLLKPYQPNSLYRSWAKITELMPTYSVGVATHRDGFAVAFTKKELEERLEDLANPKISDEGLQQKYASLKNTKTWKLSKARNVFLSKRIQEDVKIRIGPEKIKKVLYRPFDLRWTYHDRTIADRPRHEVLDNLYSKNKALVVGRSGRATPGAWDLALVSGEIVDLNVFYRGGGTVFPLIIKSKKVKKANFDENALKSIRKGLDADITAIDIFWYIYGILHCPMYREMFNQELEHDFPRIPITKDADLFYQMSDLGKEVGELHLLNEKSLPELRISFPKPGDHVVKEPRYDENNERVYINEHEFFQGVNIDIWKYTIGAYPVLYKWLKDRKGRKLTLEEIECYRRIATAIFKTKEKLGRINEIFDRILESEHVKIDLKNDSISQL